MQAESYEEVDINDNEQEIEQPDFYEPDDQESISAMNLADNEMFVSLNQ